MKPNKIVIGAILSLFSFFSSPSYSFTLSRYVGQCGDAKVALGDTEGRRAYAEEATDGTWWIVIDPRVTRKYSTYTVDFIFFHECGHVLYHHESDTGSVEDENGADCYAAERFTNTYGRGFLYPVLAELAPMNGPLRNQHILECKY